jgi:hypothetical protein
MNRRSDVLFNIRIGIVYTIYWVNRFTENKTPTSVWPSSSFSGIAAASRAY